MAKSKTVHHCDKCESIATHIYPQYKLCDQHYIEVNLKEVNNVFMEKINVHEAMEKLGFILE